MANTLFDLVVTSATMPLKGPDGTLTPVTLRIQGLNVATIKQKAIEANAYVMQAGKTNDVESLIKSLARAEKSAGEMASLAIVGWDNDDYMGGPYTPEYAKELIMRPDMEFVRKQINEFVAEQANFFRTESTVATNNPKLGS